MLKAIWYMMMLTMIIIIVYAKRSLSPSFGHTKRPARLPQHGSGFSTTSSIGTKHDSRPRTTRFIHCPWIHLRRARRHCPAFSEHRRGLHPQVQSLAPQYLDRNIGRWSCRLGVVASISLGVVARNRRSIVPTGTHVAVAISAPWNGQASRLRPPSRACPPARVPHHTAFTRH